MKPTLISKYLFTPDGASRVADVCMCDGGVDVFRPLVLRGWGIVPFDRRYWFTLYAQGGTGFSCCVFRLAEPIALFDFRDKGGAEGQWSALKHIVENVWGVTIDTEEPPAPWLGMLLMPFGLQEGRGVGLGTQVLPIVAESVAKTWIRLSDKERGEVPTSIWGLGECGGNPP